MFATTQLIGMAFGLPDVCNVPVAGVPVPTPFPNIAMTNTHVPTVLNVLIAGGPVHNLMTEGTLSHGDEAGAQMGVVSHVVMGSDTYMTGSAKVLWGPAPAVRMGSVTGQNGTPFNCAGMVSAPSQPTVTILS